MNTNIKQKLSNVVSFGVTDNSEAIIGINKISETKQWFAVVVRMNHEKKTCERLTGMGIENYVPIQQQYHKWSDRMKKVDHLVISMLVFVHIKHSERLKVLSLPTVCKFITSPGKSVPAVIPDLEMQKFKYMLDYSDECIHISNEKYKINEEVRVVKGPLSGLEGTLITIDKNTNIGIQIQGIGYAYVEMPIGFIERIKS